MTVTRQGLRVSPETLLKFGKMFSCFQLVSDSKTALDLPTKSTSYHFPYWSN